MQVFEDGIMATPPNGRLGMLRQIWAAPGNQGQRCRAVLRALRWFRICRSNLAATDKPDLLPVFGERIYPCYPDSIIAKHVMYHSEWFDYDMLHFMQAFLRPDDHFLDIGANTGLHTLLASTRITRGQITCVEPDPRNLARLRLALEINQLKNVAILPVAATDRESELTLECNDVFSRIAIENASQPSGTASKVQGRRLDHLLPRQLIHFCKVDVEGAEWLALKGLSSLIESGLLPVLVFELCGWMKYYNQDEDALLNWLSSHGYMFAKYRHSSQALSFSRPYDNDVFAFTAKGLDMVRERMPGITMEHLP